MEPLAQAAHQRQISNKFDYYRDYGLLGFNSVILTSVLVPHQIVYLEANGSRLYAEVIQILEQRQMCWVRPLMLSSSADAAPTAAASAPNANMPESALFLEDGPDLLWPTNQFKVAVDTDVIPLLGTLQSKDTMNNTPNPDHLQALRAFIRQLWEGSAPALAVDPN